MEALKQTLISAAATIVVCACIGIWAAAAAEPARAVVENLDSQLLRAMKAGPEAGQSGRYAALSPVIDRDFDMRRMAKNAAGSQWDTLDAEQRDAYVAKFRRRTIGAFARRFAAHHGERFEITGAHDVDGQGRQVDTALIGPDGARETISYVLVNEGGDWRIVRVRPSAGADLGVRPGAYAQAMRRAGIKRFLQQFERRLQHDRAVEA